MSSPSSSPSPDNESQRLTPNAIGMWGIVFFVIAAAAPLSVLVGGSPLTFRLGGIGAPGAYVAAGIVLIFFAFGFTAMSKHVANAGAFYAYIARGLGKPLGVGAALVASFSYSFICIGFFGLFGYFAQSTVLDLVNVSVPWQIWAYAGVAIVGFLGYRQVEVGAKVLSVLILGEITILLILAVAVLVRGGPEGMSLAPFSPVHVFAGGAGAMFVLAFGAFIGFEATAIYAEEARDPMRSVPRATYISLGFLAIFYGFLAWIATVALGAKGVLTVAQSDGFIAMYFNAANTYLGPWAVKVMNVLIVTSTLAALVAFHNACARYFYSLGREHLLPPALGRTHPKSQAPHVASFFQTGLSIVVVTAFVIAGADPYLHLLLWTNGFGIVGIVLCQLLCAIAAIGFFWRDRRGHTVFRVVIAPILGALGLTAGLYLIIKNFQLLSGTTGWVNWMLLLPVPALLLIGIGIAYRVKRNDPKRYSDLVVATVEMDAPVLETS